MDRRATESLGIPSLCLMENAGAGAARIAREMLARRAGTVVCACGPGGNGGDAMVVARHLAIDGFAVRLLHLPGRSAGDAELQRRICAAMGLASSEFVGGRDLVRANAPALVVDGLFGTGLARALDGLAAEFVEAINAASAPVLALDLPSGLDCDSGDPLGPCVRASVTATFVAPKLGFANPASKAWTGDVRVVTIGAPLDWPL